MQCNVVLCCAKVGRTRVVIVLCMSKEEGEEEDKETLVFF